MVLFVSGALTIIVLIYWLLQGKRGALQALLLTAFLLYGIEFAKTMDFDSLDAVFAMFLFGACGAVLAFLLTWMLSRVVDAVREWRRRSLIR
jgi:hypothetical protein